MSKGCRIICETYDKLNGNLIERKELMNVDIIKPQLIDDIGLDYQAQLQLVQASIDKVVELQGPLVNEYSACPKCNTPIRKNGKKECVVHAMHSDHKIEIQKYRCHKCDWMSPNSIKSIYGTDTHTSLTKIQAELGSNYSFRKVASILQQLSGNRSRDINNQVKIKRVVMQVGAAIEAYNKSAPTTLIETPAKSLIVQVDGAHLSTTESNKRSFEAMTATIFKPEDVKALDNTKSIVITHKTCIASAKDDKQASMKEMIINAALRHGMTKETRITGLSDGAENCKSVMLSLLPYCAKLDLILDWFHISMRFQNMMSSALPSDQQEVLKKAKWKLWHGLKEDCFDKLEDLIPQITNEKLKTRAEQLLQYLQNNADILVNYDTLKNTKQPCTSNVAESTVENLVNSRYRQTGKMKWTREGAHTLLQIKAASYSNTLSKIWGYVFSNILKVAV
jgi:hypothetical protein